MAAGKSAGEKPGMELPLYVERSFTLQFPCELAVGMTITVLQS